MCCNGVSVILRLQTILRRPPLHPDILKLRWWACSATGSAAAGWWCWATRCLGDQRRRGVRRELLCHGRALFAAYGIFYAIDEAQSNAFIADIEPERRATAVGVYNFVTGALYLPASLVAGLSVMAIGAFGLLRPGARES